MRLLLVAVALALLAPVAAAQVPAAPNCGPLTLGAVTPPDPLPPGGEGDVSVAVQNGNQAFTLAVTVSATTTTAGWKVVSGDQQVTVAPGGTGSVKFHVQATKDAKDSMVINFAATGACQGPNPQLSCPAGVSQCVVTAAGTGSVQLQQGGGLAFPGLDNLNFPIEYVIAGVVLVALAIAIPLLVRKRRPALAADCPEPLKMVRPGRGTSFPIDIRNPTAQAMTAAFEVGPVPEGWSAFMPLPEVQLAPKEARSLWLMVRAPQNAETGATADVEVRLRDTQRPESKASVKVRAEVNPNASEGPTRPS
ncbi:MAG: hypothetical protein QOE90_2665 [Thermoplasmata archaeon]|jgi:hypothetical protein|nr:hypothetical protein [Thermoplasmata archaeon]